MPSRGAVARTAPRLRIPWRVPHSRAPSASVPPRLAACLPVHAPLMACTLPAAGSDVFDKEGRFVMKDFDRAKPMAPAAC